MILHILFSLYIIADVFECPWLVYFGIIFGLFNFFSFPKDVACH